MSATSPPRSPSSRGIDESHTTQDHNQERSPTSAPTGRFRHETVSHHFRGLCPHVCGPHVQAENNEAVRKLAIEEFKAIVQDIVWYDAQYDNLALPSIVSIQDDDTNEDVLDGYDFPITPSDARQYAADKMLAALEFVRMTFADIDFKTQGVFHRVPENRRGSHRRSHGYLSHPYPAPITS